MLDPDAFQQWFTGFMQQFAEGGADAGVLVLDGKTLRRSYDRAEQRSPLHPVSTWAEEQRLVLGQLAVDAKSNEITALPKLLKCRLCAAKWLPPMPCTASVKWRSR